MIADASARFLVGTRLTLLGRSPLQARESHERAERQLASATPGVQTSSLRCLNLTRLAGERARREEGVAAALELIARAAELAQQLDPRMQAEIERTRGVVLAGAGRIPEALGACDAALDLLGRIGAAAESALVLRLRADVSRRSGDVAEARRNLMSARSIYRQLVDPAAEAGVALGLLELALSEADEPAAAAHEAAILLLLPDDYLLRNQIGIVYFQAGRHEQAVAHYTAGLAMAREAAIFANRARARLRWARDENAPAGLPELAREDLTTAFELDPDDLDAGIELAELARDLGDGTAAAKTAEVVARRIVEVARELPLPPAGSPDASERAGIVRRLRDLLIRGLSLLGPMPTAEILAAWAPAQADEELELIRAIAGHELSGAEGRGLAEAITAAERAVGAGDPPRGRALVELAALHARARHWHDARSAAEEAMHDETVRVQAEYMLDRLDQMHRRDDEFGGEPETVAEELVVDIAENLRQWFDPESPVGKEFFGWMIEAFRRARQERVGLPPPGLCVGVRNELTPGTIHVVVDKAVRMRITAGGELLADVTPADALALAGIEGRPAARPWDGGPATWLDATAREALVQAGITFWDPRGLVLAGLDQALEATPRFVSAEEAAALSGEAWVGLSPTEFLRRADVVQELIAGRVPPADLPRVLADHREAAEGARSEVIAAAIRRFAVPVASAQSLAAAFACTTFKAPATVGGSGARLVTEIVVSVGTAVAEVEDEALVAGSGRVIGPLCRALGVPEPDLRIAHDPDLGDRGVAVAIGGVTRLCASPASELDWVRCHPVAGTGGRTGKAGGGVGGSVARALEAVLWDDPALLLGDPEVARQAFGEALGGVPTNQVIVALLDALSRSVPLGPPDRLKPAVDRLNPRSRTGINRLPAARTFVSSPRRPVPDNLPFGIRDTLHVDERGKLRQFAVRVLLHHDREADVRVRLTAPTGRTVVLHDCGDELDILRGGVDQEQIPGLAVVLNERAQRATGRSMCRTSLRGTPVCSRSGQSS